jgi:uncharacterized protein YjbI with pentapeptide repeats
MRRETKKGSHDSVLRRGQPFVPLRELFPWRDVSAKEKEAVKDAKEEAKDAKGEAKEARDDASDLIRITNQDLCQARTELSFFLAAVLFVAIATLSITDRDLLFGSRVLLPVLGVSMSFDAFLLGSPILLLVGHYALLLKFSWLRTKCIAINELIEGADGARTLALKTTSNFMAQWLIASTGNTFYQRLSSAIYFTSIFLAPLLTLLLLTIRTLPLHRPWLTFIQILALSLDVALLTLFHWNGRRQRLWAAAVGSGTWLIVSLTLCIPDGLFDVVGRFIWEARVPFGWADSSRTAFAPTAFLLENGLDNATGRPILFFSRNLIVTDDQGWRGSANATQQTSSTPTQDHQQSGPNFRGRDLRYATLDRSNLRGGDFRLADLTGASLDDADLRGAIFGCAAANIDPLVSLWASTVYRNAQGYWMDSESNCTVMNDIKLSRADFRESKFEYGQLRKPSLAGARLSGVNFDDVDLSNMDLSLASLNWASMVGANLSGAILIGANLAGADLTGANLRDAELRLTALTFAKFDGAHLVGAKLVVADLTNASFIGAELGEAVFYGAHFDSTAVWGATPPAKEFLAWTDLTGALVDKPEPVHINNMRASLARGSEITRNFTSVRLNPVLEMIDADPELIARNEAWTSLRQMLRRKQDDSSFRNAVSQVINENACQVSQFTRSVELWARPNYNYSDYPLKKTPEPPPAPPDPNLNVGPKVTFATPGLESEYYPVAVAPLPEWFDLGPLIARLERGDCPASKEVAPRLLASLKWSREFRRPPLPRN